MRTSAASRTEHGCWPMCRECRSERARVRQEAAPVVLWGDPGQSGFTRDDIAERYGDGCFYCGGLFQAVDHYIPVSRGGAHTLANVRPACNRCNSRKGVKMPEGIQ
jgi:5-methylcytosine-specific restriction endonuclease McrA